MRKAILDELQSNALPMFSNMGGMMPGMGMPVPNSDDPNCTDMVVGEARTDMKDPDYFIITSATPLGLSTNNLSKGDIVTLSWLCKSKSGDMYTLCTNYIMDHPDIEKEIVSDIPFHDKSMYISQLAVNNMLLNNLDCYVTDMIFSTTSDMMIENTEFSVVGVDLKTKERYEFFVSNTIFASMAYLDNYILDNTINHYEIMMAITSALSNNDNAMLADFDENLHVVSMAPVDKSTSVAVIFEAKSSDLKKYTVLVSFDVGKKFSRGKFKGMKVDKMEENFLKDGDQYLTVFTFITTIKNLDKEFMVIKAKNKNGEYKIFMMDTNCRQSLTDKVSEF